METTAIKSCKQEKCNVAKDGKCLEGLNFNDCTHFFWNNGDPVEKKQEDVEAKPIPTVHLLTGEEWTLKSLGEILSKYAARRVFVIGDSDCGKTTLLVKLYNLFQVGSFRDFSFAGSTTLHGFERRAHLSRVESKADEEQTEKTKSNEFSFLHLAVKPKDDNVFHILLSDISGERLQLARDSSLEMKELDLLKNSDFILIMIDGARIADRRERTATLLKSQTFLRQALDDGVISDRNRVRVVLTKWDICNASDGFNFTRDIVTPFEQLFKARIPNLTFLTICSRSRAPEQVDSAHGLHDLLLDWTLVETIDVNREKFSKHEASNRSISNYFAL